MKHYAISIKKAIFLTGLNNIHNVKKKKETVCYFHLNQYY